MTHPTSCAPLQVAPLPMNTHYTYHISQYPTPRAASYTCIYKKNGGPTRNGLKHGHVSVWIQPV